MRINWGAGIAATYILFATATGGFVAFAMSRPVSLVSRDYYADSLREDQHMAATQNAQALGTTLEIASDGHDRIHISLPPAHAPVIQGSVTLYRASDAAADRAFPFLPDVTGEQQVNVRELPRGLWLVQLRWKANGRDYYFERPVILK
jgi:FixH protein